MQLKEQAIRLALEQGGWYEARAAAVLGIPRSTFKYLLLKKYTKLAREAEKQRAASGYRGGKPQEP